jgi:hypothetical protein
MMAEHRPRGTRYAVTPGVDFSEAQITGMINWREYQNAGNLPAST